MGISVRMYRLLTCGTRVTFWSSRKWMVGIAVKRTRVCRNLSKTMSWGGKKQLSTVSRVYHGTYGFSTYP
jgi:hypothetical protein